MQLIDEKTLLIAGIRRLQAEATLAQSMDDTIDLAERIHNLTDCLILVTESEIDRRKTR